MTDLHELIRNLLGQQSTQCSSTSQELGLCSAVLKYKISSCYQSNVNSCQDLEDLTQVREGVLCFMVVNLSICPTCTP